MNFLSGMLRDEGGLDYKAAIADTIITIIEGNPEAKETGECFLFLFIYNYFFIPKKKLISTLCIQEKKKADQLFYNEPALNAEKSQLTKDSFE